ncbi:MAG: DegV family protein [Lachnospiraceae bacterium]|nr:DegV family protein [Lachnospiraceae bacterium]MBQ8261142.1 DegV family protein [Lachnospiraceae bacterium]
MIRIITDSASDFNLAEAAQKGVTVLPMKVQFGDTTYLAGENLSAEDFYKKLIESDELPTTSQITPYDFTEEFQKVSDAGDSAVVILLSSELSGTVQSAMLAASEFDNIHVVDSLNVTIGEQCLIYLAIKLREDGKSAAEIAKILTEKREKVQLLALLDTLEYLKKGGRISATTAFAGNLLSIKPVIKIEEGKVVMLGKARGSKNGNNMLKEMTKKYEIDFDAPIVLGYTGLSTNLLDKYVEDSKELWEGKVDTLPVALVGSTIGTHAGPGAIAVSFFYK